MKKLYTLLSVLVVAFFFGGIAVTAAHAAPITVDADVSAPELVSASLVADEVEPGDEVSVRWSARDDGGIEYVSFAFKAPTGRTFYLSTYAYGTTATGLQNGFASTNVDGGSWPTGTYTLAYVTLSDTAGNSSTKSAYDPDFQTLTFDVRRGGATPPASEQPTSPSTPPTPTDTPPLEPTETAVPAPDTAAPEFHSLQVTAATFRDPNFGIMWTAIDESPLANVMFELRMPDGSVRWVLHALDPLTQLPGLQLSTYIADLSDGTWPNGDYEILTVRLTDSAGNVSEHTAATWNPDIAPQNFTVDLPLVTPLPTVEPTLEPTVEPSMPPTTGPTVTSAPVGPSQSSTATASAPSELPASGLPVQTEPSEASPSADGLATTGVEGIMTIWLGLGSIVLVAGISLLLLRRKPSEH